MVLQLLYAEHYCTCAYYVKIQSRDSPTKLTIFNEI